MDVMVIDQAAIDEEEVDLARVHFAQLIERDRLAICQAGQNEVCLYLDPRLERRIHLHLRLDRVTTGRGVG